MPTDTRRRRRHGFAPPSELLDELADLNDDGTARHLDRARELAEAETRNAEADAIRSDLAIIVRLLTKGLGRASQLLERLEAVDAREDAARARDRARNGEDLRDHRETGRKCCGGQSDVRRRQQAKVIVQGQVGRMEVR
jgi:hypothetical protein